MFGMFFFYKCSEYWKVDEYELWEVVFGMEFQGKFMKTC